MEEIWKDEPLFVVHVGVAGSRKEISIEVKGKNGPYLKKDALGQCRCDEYIDGPGTN